MIENGIQGIPELETKLTAWFQRAEGASLAKFRQAVWVIFVEILWQTPQWTGSAVANWRLGINAPDNAYDPSLGDRDELIFQKSRHSKDGMTIAQGTHHKEDQKWIKVAKDLNQPKLKLIQRMTDKVYITNNVVGDTDGGRADARYMEALQDRDYWQKKLRAINRPYEVAAETVIRMADTSDFTQFEIHSLGDYKV